MLDPLPKSQARFGSVCEGSARIFPQQDKESMAQRKARAVACAQLVYADPSGRNDAALRMTFSKI